MPLRRPHAEVDTANSAAHIMSIVNKPVQMARRSRKRLLSDRRFIGVSPARIHLPLSSQQCGVAATETCGNWRNYTQRKPPIVSAVMATGYALLRTECNLTSVHTFDSARHFRMSNVALYLRFVRNTPRDKQTKQRFKLMFSPLILHPHVICDLI